MKLLTRNTDYAVRAVCYMAKRKDELVSVPELVKALRIPRPFLRKILQVLNKKGILKSHKGSGGGFELARKPRDIYLPDIMEAFQGPFELNECFFKKEICPNKKTCVLKKKIDLIEKSVLKQLKAITIDSILEAR